MSAPGGPGLTSYPRGLEGLGRSERVAIDQARADSERPAELLLSLRCIRGGAQKTQRLGEDPTPQHGTASGPAPGPDVEPGSGLRITGSD